jgi:hypothetical protein
MTARLSIQDVREARQASRHLPSNDYDAAVLLEYVTRPWWRRLLAAISRDQ